MASPEKPWHHHLTIDLIALILQRSVFHPFIAWLVPLCLGATATPTDSPAFIGSCLYAALITLIWLSSVLDARIAYGAPRELAWDEEVVLITGGASGLGRILAETYGMRGASVAVLDVQVPSKQDLSEGLARVKFYRCDVGDADAVEGVKKLVENDLGPPTILINNAGIVTGKPLLSLTPASASRTIHINLLSHFHTLHTFLPGLLASPTGGTIVTIASVLGKLGAANLTDYAASKAGLIAMHASLRAELTGPSAPAGAENVRMVLVAPGQLSTRLFAGVETPSNFFGPVVEPVELARAIVRIVDSGMSGEVRLPLYAQWIDWLQVLPAGVQAVVRRVSGVDRAMEGFASREKKE